MNALELCLQDEVRPYCRGSREEVGGLITTDFEFISFKNVSETPTDEILMGDDGFEAMMKLLSEDKLYAWVHSHIGRPTPSLKDIVQHKLNTRMIIYSVQEDRFVTYQPEDVRKAAFGLTNGDNK